MPLSSHPTKFFIDRDSSLDMIPNGALKESFGTNEMQSKTKNRKILSKKQGKGERKRRRR
jgi:hypothetical protein